MNVESRSERLISQLDMSTDEELDERTGIGKLGVTYVGKAVGRTKTHVHLAIDSGVLAIPIADIGQVFRLSKDDDSIVRIAASRGGDSVRFVKDSEDRAVPRESLDIDPMLMGRSQLGGGVFGGGGLGFHCHPTNLITVTNGIFYDDDVILCHW